MAAGFLLVENIGKLITLEGAIQKGGRRITVEDLSVIENAVLLCEVKPGGKILWVGKKSEASRQLKKMKIPLSKISRHDAHGGTVIPGFVDSHTHLVFAGDRSLDFERRLQGWTYQQIAAEGGGILTTMKATRKAKYSELLSLAMARVENAKRQGITTMEIKTGYGLDFKSEKKLLDVISELKKKSGLTVKATFLAAHALPPEFKDRHSDYIQEIALKWLPKLKTQIDFVDIFLDQGYFNKQNAKELLTEAAKFGLGIKIHADEIALTGGAETAVQSQALSADHLLKITSNEIAALSASEVTATLLPTTALFLGEAFAPARALLDGGARVALATDFNPGTSPAQDVSLTALLAALQLKMRPEEILVALTLNGAYALGLEKSKGALVPGHDADFVILPSQSVTGFFYNFGKMTSGRLEVCIYGRFIKES